MTESIEILESDASATLPAHAELAVLVSSPVAADTFTDAVSAPVAGVILRLQSIWRARRSGEFAVDRVALVVIDDGSTPREFAESFFEALRGVCGSLTLELAPSGFRINLIRAASLDDCRSTLAYLADERAIFVTGSTIDLLDAPLDGGGR